MSTLNRPQLIINHSSCGIIVCTQTTLQMTLQMRYGMIHWVMSFFIQKECKNRHCDIPNSHIDVAYLDDESSSDNAIYLKMHLLIELNKIKVIAMTISDYLEP